MMIRKFVDGEFMNLEIKKLELKEKFNSKVMLKSLSTTILWKNVLKFNGIWSIAGWDNKNKKLVLSNDRLSENLYFT